MSSMQKRQLRHLELELLLRPTRSLAKQIPQASAGFDRQRSMTDRLSRREVPENEAALLLGKHYYILQPQTEDLCNRALNDLKPETIQSAFTELKRQGLNEVAKDLKSELRAKGVKDFSETKKRWTEDDAIACDLVGGIFGVISILISASKLLVPDAIRRIDKWHWGFVSHGIYVCADFELDGYWKFIAHHGALMALTTGLVGIGLSVFGNLKLRQLKTEETGNPKH